MQIYKITTDKTLPIKYKCFNSAINPKNRTKIDNIKLKNKEIINMLFELYTALFLILKWFKLYFVENIIVPSENKKIITNRINALNIVK